MRESRAVLLTLGLLRQRSTFQLGNNCRDPVSYARVNRGHRRTDPLRRGRGKVTAHLLDLPGQRGVDLFRRGRDRTAQRRNLLLGRLRAELGQVGPQLRLDGLHREFHLGPKLRAQGRNKLIQP